MGPAVDSAAETEIDVAETVDELIGRTPLLRLDAFADNCFGKLESHNPYSVKDRIARGIIDAAERAGALEPDDTVVESTSGNTGIGLAAVCAARGYDCVLTMPASMSTERRQLLSALGADLELTPAEDGMGGANERAEEIVAEREDAIMREDLESTPEIIGEAVQTILRREGQADAYERVKAVTRGKDVTIEDFREMFDDLEVDEDVREELHALTPTDYVGVASDLVDDLE